MRRLRMIFQLCRARSSRAAPSLAAVTLLVAGAVLVLLPVAAALAAADGAAPGEVAPQAQPAAPSASASAPAPAAEALVPIPRLWRIERRLQRPDYPNLKQIRFLTETEYPPFSYVADNGELVGFNVDLARMLCIELELECTIRAEDWDTLLPSLEDGEGDAVIASVALSEENRSRFDFSDRYYLTPARFAGPVALQLQEVTPEAVAGRRVAVVAGGAHEAYLRDFFKAAEVVTFERREDAREALKSGAVELLFDDGISLSFWLNGTNAAGCCRFVGGPFVEARYFGNGVGIAIAKGSGELRTALNYGLRKLYRDGRYSELFLRYFPISFY